MEIGLNLSYVLTARFCSPPGNLSFSQERAWGQHRVPWQKNFVTDAMHANPQKRVGLLTSEVPLRSHGQSSILTSPSPVIGRFPPLCPQFPLLCNAACPGFLSASPTLVRSSEVHALGKWWGVEPTPGLHRLGLAVCLSAPHPHSFSLGGLCGFHCSGNNWAFYPLCIWELPRVPSADQSWVETLERLRLVALAPCISQSCKALAGTRTPEAVQQKHLVNGTHRK